MYTYVYVCVLLNIDDPIFAYKTLSMCMYMYCMQPINSQLAMYMYVCMYVCMCVQYVCMYVHVCMYVCMYVCMSNLCGIYIQLLII